ncbi:DUF3310 domain-containing protein [Staphylococcus sp. GDY8P31P]|uniref:DUF3310 domain-containing protein n=1 Tax=Staphylococcus sp. GDY8P31P TaxID=2804115 RepID=UPI001FDA94E7|nr:DUF3310 domain-containing protein [Staphylococcus sp. GDY8P31P]
MKISDLKIGNYVVVNDLGAGKYSSGMRVIGRVVKIDDKGNYAIIESLPKHRYDITDFNDFELWTKEIADKTESMSDSEGLSGFTVDEKLLEEAKEKGIDELRKRINQSNDLQQRKRKDNVNSPSHYNYGDIEVIDFIEQVTKHYNPNVAYHIGNAIKYLARSPHKNGKEDVDKARWYIERAFENWEQ